MNGVEINTERLICRSLNESLIASLLDYSIRNAEHLAPWEPKREADFLSTDKFRGWCNKQIESINAKQSLRFLVSLCEMPDRVIAMINYSSIAPLPSLSCNLGYSIDRELQGKGLITEGIRATNAYMFSTLKVHRIAANYMPRNKASGAVLRKLGFSIEGYARDYLRIAARWEDHVLTALINDKWTE
jgi:[ribosomal protein S5]-alanine N-acetyltransferase